MANKIMKPKAKTRAKSKATVKAKPSNKPVEKNPWKVAVLEMFALINDSEYTVDDDLYEQLSDIVVKTCNTTVVCFNKMIDDHIETQKEAKRFKKILAMTALQSAWKSLTSEQQELLRDLDADEFVEQITE